MINYHTIQIVESLKLKVPELASRKQLIEFEGFKLNETKKLVPFFTNFIRETPVDHPLER